MITATFVTHLRRWLHSPEVIAVIMEVEGCSQLRAHKIADEYIDSAKPQQGGHDGALPYGDA